MFRRVFSSITIMFFPQLQDSHTYCKRVWIWRNNSLQFPEIKVKFEVSYIREFHNNTQVNKIKMVYTESNMLICDKAVSQNNEK